MVLCSQVIKVNIFTIELISLKYISAFVTIYIRLKKCTQF